MSLIIGESKIPQLCVAHLTARIQDADNPMPALVTLPQVAGPVLATKRVYPSVEVWCPEFKIGAHRSDEQYDIHLDLYVDDHTSITTQLGWLGAIRRSFAGGPDATNSNATDANTNPFFAYLAGLSTQNKTGWSIVSFSITGGGIHVLDEKRLLMRTTAHCLFRSYTFTV